jgi:hypothetical protein
VWRRRLHLPFFLFFSSARHNLDSSTVAIQVKLGHLLKPFATYILTLPRDVLRHGLLKNQHPDAPYLPGASGPADVARAEVENILDVFLAFVAIPSLVLLDIA